MDNRRREFIEKSIAAGIASLLVPSLAFAKWPQDAFEKTDLAQALAAISQGDPQNGDITLIAPKIAENGAQVRVEVQAKIANVESISILVDKNPVPLTSQFLMMGESEPYVATNLKVRETSNVIALVKADGQYYSARQEVKVTAGGCG